MFRTVLELLGLKRVLILIASSVIAIGLSSGVAYYKGYHKAETLCVSRENAKSIQGITNRGKIQKEVMGLPDPDLDDRLSKWMRD